MPQMAVPSGSFPRTVGNISLDIFEGGTGKPLLLLHGEEGFDPGDAYVGLLARSRRVIAPVHPGFGKSELPDWLDHVEDIANLYLQLVEDDEAIDVVGCSLGAWIAADIASKVPGKVRRLVLSGPFGVKFASSDRLDFPDIFALSPAALETLNYRPRDAAAQLLGGSDEQLATVVRNRETFALLSWEPFMHDPKLKHRLHRLSMPTLLLRGADDRVVGDGYLAEYGGHLADASVGVVPGAGHAAEHDAPDAFSRAVLAFLDA